MAPFYELANMLQNRQGILVIEGKMIDQEEGSMTEVIFLQCHVRFSLVRNATKHYGGRRRQHGLRSLNEQTVAGFRRPAACAGCSGGSRRLLTATTMRTNNEQLISEASCTRT
jgi:hypothetical protein